VLGVTPFTPASVGVRDVANAHRPASGTSAAQAVRASVADVERHDEEKQQTAKQKISISQLKPHFNLCCSVPVELRRTISPEQTSS
jgi:hypothetical protein